MEQFRNVAIRCRVFNKKFTYEIKIERAQRAAKSSGEGKMSKPVAKRTKGKEKAEK